MSSNYPKYIVGVVDLSVYSNYIYTIQQLKRIGYTTPATMPIECKKCYIIIDVHNSYVSADPVLSTDDNLSKYKDVTDYLYCGDVKDNYFYALAKYFYINQTQCGKDLFTFWIHSEQGRWHYCSDKKFHNYMKAYRLATISEIIAKMKEESDMCPYCKGCHIHTTDDYIDVYIDNANKTMNISYDAYSCDSSFNDSIQINYCPMCGRKL